MSGLLETLDAEERRLLRPAPPGEQLVAEPMRAQLSDRRDFTEGGWLFERKLDGVRLLAVRDGGVALRSRTGKRQEETYPELVDALQAQECADFVVDGEVVALSGGRTDFSLLQQRMQLSRAWQARSSGVVVTYFLFDLLRLAGQDVTRLPLRTRKSLLRRALSFDQPLRFTTHRNTGGPERLQQACDRGWEGLIAKRADGRYLHRRSTHWLKLKCERAQETVIGGFTEPSGSRLGFGALLVGYYDGAALRYAGKVGTGYSERVLRELRARMDTLVTEHSPFADPVPARAVHWLRPALVAQVGFAEWTRDGLLRHPRYLGLRDDKAPEDVVREVPLERR